MELRPRCVIFFLLLALVSASGSQVSGSRISRRLVASPPSEDLVIAGPTPTPRAPPPSSNTRPALITPSANAPGADLPPKDLHAPPPPPASPVTPVSSGSGNSRSKTAVTLGVTLGVVVVVLAAVSAAVYFKPEWLPCWKGRSSRHLQYERHVPT